MPCISGADERPVKSEKAGKGEKCWTGKGNRNGVGWGKGGCGVARVKDEGA